MSISDKKRQAIRKQYNFSCGYCGVSEVDTGNELEIDHFRPLRQGGSDDDENLVYACTACNRNKAAYWPAADAPAHMHLLHPLRDSLEAHITLLQDGQFAGLTPRGWFHIEWLNLNRSQLIKRRQSQMIYKRTQSLIYETQKLNQDLRKLIASQEQELIMLRKKIQRLSGSES